MSIASVHIERAISGLLKAPEFSDLKPPGAKFIELSEKYLNQLIFWNKTHDLVGPLKSIEEFLLTHFTDSLASYHICNKDRPVAKVRYMDIGTGAGIPGFFWHFLFQDQGFEVETILLEPREKRVHFMEEVIRKLALTNIHPLKERVDGLPKLALEFVDICTARALKLTEKDIKILKKIETNKSPEIIWLTGPETEALKGWELLAEYSLATEAEHRRRAYVVI